MPFHASKQEIPIKLYISSMTQSQKGVSLLSDLTLPAHAAFGIQERIPLDNLSLS